MSPSAPPQPNTSSTTALNPQSSPLSPSLSDRQLAAIPLILAGHTDTDVAAKLGVARETIYRWRHRNPAFIATLNAHRHQHHAATADRYDRLLNNYMDLLEQISSFDNPAWADDQIRIATSLLRSANLRPRTLAAPTNPADILQSLLSQGLPPDIAPDTDPQPGESTGGHRGGHGGSTRGAQG